MARSTGETTGDQDSPQPLSLTIVSALQRRILSGELPIGTWLRHGAVAEEFGISRTPVREALRILDAQGIVSIVPNRGARVNGHSSRDIREIGVVRAELEGLAAELAAEQMNDEQTARLRTAWTRFTELMDKPASREEMASAWATANEDFHSVIFEAARNRQLTQTIGELRRRLPHNVSYAAYEGNTRQLQRNVQEHEAIAAAILAHDGKRARRLMTEHIRRSNEAIARWVDQMTDS